MVLMAQWTMLYRRIQTLTTELNDLEALGSECEVLKLLTTLFG